LLEAVEEREYYPSGQVSEYTLKSPDGSIITSRRWSETGELVWERNLSDGALNGRQYSRVDRGGWVEEHYVDDVLHGVTTRWSAEGQKISERSFVAGEPSGAWREWYDDGRLRFAKQVEDDRVLTVEVPGTEDLPIVPVSTLEQLIEAIGPRRRIVLRPGAYNVSRLAPDLRTAHASVNGGLEITEVDNLVIEAEDSGRAHLFVEDPRAFVLSLRECTGVTLSGLRLGHEVPAESLCQSGVLAITRSDAIRITGCTLYGSGISGMTLTAVTDLVFSGSTISDCTESFLSMNDCLHLQLLDSSFVRTGGSGLFRLVGSEDVLFQDCEVADSWSRDSLFSLQSVRDLRVREVRFTDNLAWTLLSQSPEADAFVDCSFSGNGFLPPGQQESPATAQLYEALAGAGVEQVRAAIAAGADASCPIGPTPLYVALSSLGPQSREILEVLLAAGADPNQLSMTPASTWGDGPAFSFVTRPLHVLCGQPFSEDAPPEQAEARLAIAGLLLDHGADVNGRTSAEQTPLLAAILGGQTEIVRLLLERGADVNASGVTGTTALHLAAQLVDPDLVGMLLARDADPNARDHTGNAPLHHVAAVSSELIPDPEGSAESRRQIILALLAAGADSALENGQGQSPAELALARGLHGLVPLLGPVEGGRERP
jgi:hypothetical protein